MNHLAHHRHLLRHVPPPSQYVSKGHLSKWRPQAPPMVLEYVWSKKRSRWYTIWNQKVHPLDHFWRFQSSLEVNHFKPYRTQRGVIIPEQECCPEMWDGATPTCWDLSPLFLIPLAGPKDSPGAFIEGEIGWNRNYFNYFNTRRVWAPTYTIHLTSLYWPRAVLFGMMLALKIQVRKSLEKSILASTFPQPKPWSRGRRPTRGWVAQTELRRPSAKRFSKERFWHCRRRRSNSWGWHFTMALQCHIREVLRICHICVYR